MTAEQKSDLVRWQQNAVQRYSGSMGDPVAVTARLREVAQHCHLVAPATSCPTLPEGCEVALSAILVDPNACYTVEGKLALPKAELQQIAGAAGVSWVPEHVGADGARQGSRRLDDGSDPSYCRYLAVGVVRGFDGSPRTITGEKEMDLRDGSPQIVALQERAAQKGRDAGRQIRELRLHIMGHAETKAQLRAIRSLGIKTSYAREELARPFVCARTVFTGRSDDPEIRRIFAAAQAQAMLGGVSALYGAPAAPGRAALPAGDPPPPLLRAAAEDTDDDGFDPQTGEVFDAEDDGDDFDYGPPPLTDDEAADAADAFVVSPPPAVAPPTPSRTPGPPPAGPPAPGPAPGPARNNGGGDKPPQVKVEGEWVAVPDAPDEALAYWGGRIARDLDEGRGDPKYAKRDVARLAAIKAEQQRRKGQGAGGERW